MISQVGIAWAQAGGGAPSGGGGILVSLIPFILIFVIFYFLLIRPQQQRAKQHRAMLEALKKGDRVITTGGLWGSITNIGKQSVTLQIAENTKVKIDRDQIARLQADDDE